MVIPLALLIAPVQAAGIRGAQPYSLTFEVMGRTVLYGITLERALTPQSALGLGLAKAQAQGSDAATALIPVSYYQYFADQEISPFFNAGLTYVSNSSEVGGRAAILGTLRYPSFPLMAHAGLGWEVRQENGFLFRLQALVTRSSSFSFSTGFNLGVTF